MLTLGANEQATFQIRTYLKDLTSQQDALPDTRQGQAQDGVQTEHCRLFRTERPSWRGKVRIAHLLPNHLANVRSCQMSLQVRCYRGMVIQPLSYMHHRYQSVGEQRGTISGAGLQEVQ